MLIADDILPTRAVDGFMSRLSGETTAAAGDRAKGDRNDKLVE